MTKNEMAAFFCRWIEASGCPLLTVGYTFRKSRRQELLFAIELDGLSADGAQVLIAPRLGVTRADRDADDTVTKTPLPAAHQALVLASAVTVRKSMADDGTR